MVCLIQIRRWGFLLGYDYDLVEARGSGTRRLQSAQEQRHAGEQARPFHFACEMRKAEPVQRPGWYACNFCWPSLWLVLPQQLSRPPKVVAMLIVVYDLIFSMLVLSYRQADNSEDGSSADAKLSR